MRTLLIALSLLVMNPDRDYWCDMMYKMAEPVLSALSEEKLHEKMNVEVSPEWDGRNEEVAYLECIGRLMSGLAPWLALPDDDTPEGIKRKQLREWALKGLAHAVDPSSPDYMLWRSEGQTLVDAAFLAEGFLRAWDTLWVPLDEVTKQRYVEEFSQLRRVDPPYNNWLLFSSTVEALLAKAGAPYDRFRVSVALRKTEEWYVGDGCYSDGMEFDVNYYNSYVIQPMYLETMQAMTESGHADYKDEYERALKRMQRYSVLLERLISPEGTFPVLGRSSTYRLAAMQPLSLLVWYDKLPDVLNYGQVRAALSATIHRMFDVNENFSPDGFLTLGFCGSQPGMADSYTNTGSLYMNSMIFMPLGLPADHPFWTATPEPWTQVKAWNGQPFPKDHAYHE